MCSLRCIQVIAGVLGRAGESGQQKRLEAAATGNVTWDPPEGLGAPVNEDGSEKQMDTEADRKNMLKEARRELLGGRDTD